MKESVRGFHVWTLEEIQAEPDNGWFYGLCRIDGRLFLGECYPGFGAAEQVTEPLRDRNLRGLLWDLWVLARNFRWMIRDLRHFRPHAAGAARKTTGEGN